MAAHLESVRRALAQQDAEVDRFKAIIQENSALNERILEHEDTIARQAAALSTLRSRPTTSHSQEQHKPQRGASSSRTLLCKGI